MEWNTENNDFGFPGFNCTNMFHDRLLGLIARQMQIREDIRAEIQQSVRMTPKAMNPTSRAILQTVLATDPSLSGLERGMVQRLIDGQPEVIATAPGVDERLLVTQKRAAELLSVSRSTIWRMTKDCVLHPTEIIPGVWRYPFQEIIALAQKGAEAVAEGQAHREKSAA